MNMQPDILEWCQTQPLNTLKHHLTVKSPQNIHYLKLILTHQPQTKPVQRLSHAYSETKVKDEKCLYVRDKFRYKKRKEQKNKMEKILLQNITVSRIHPYALSVKRSFIESQQLKKNMLLFSEDSAFRYIEPLKQFNVKIGGGTEVMSFWFNFTHQHSFCEWFIYLLQLEIYQLFKNKKGSKNVNIHSDLGQLNHFTFVDQNVKMADIKKWLQTIINSFCENRYNHMNSYSSKPRQSIFEQHEEEQEPKLEIKKEEAPYLLQRCLEKFDVKDRTMAEVIFQYQWYCEDRYSKVNRILKELCKFVVKKFRDEEICRKAQLIQDMSMSKKKKKKNKKNKPEEKDAEEVQEKSQEKSQEFTQQSNKSESFADDEVLKLGPKVEQKIEQPSDLFDPKLTQSQTPKKSPKTKKSKHKNTLQKINKVEREQITPKIPLSDHKHPPESKKHQLSTQKINEYVLAFEQQLTISSQAIDKYRKICLQTIEQCLKDMQPKTPWQIILFGSYSIDFALRSSDIDVLIAVQHPFLTLEMIQQHFKVQQWLRSCKITQIQSAKVDILEFEIILSQLKHPKLKENKKINQVIHVDLSISTRKMEHEGLKNTAIMKEIFSQYPDLKIICTVFKELLNIYDLNRPYTGGMGSYVLVLLTHNIMKYRKISIDGDYLKIMMEICTFMTEQFQPFKTVISVSSLSQLEADPKVELNIEDPTLKNVVTKVKIRQINEIVQLLNQFKKMLKDVQLELSQINGEERKKMKRVFYEHWNILFKPNEQVKL